MENDHFYNETKYCTRCADYVRFLRNLEASYCVHCGSKVKLFSAKDRRSFINGLKEDKERRRNKAGNNKRAS